MDQPLRQNKQNTSSYSILPSEVLRVVLCGLYLGTNLHQNDLLGFVSRLPLPWLLSSDQFTVWQPLAPARREGSAADFCQLCCSRSPSVKCLLGLILEGTKCHRCYSDLGYSPQTDSRQRCNYSNQAVDT